MPKRIQRKRVKGWRMPENAVSICRPGCWGNPYKDGNAAECVEKFRKSIEMEYILDYLAENFFTSRGDDHWTLEEWLAPLRGKDLACWCKEGEPCHGDVLLELANR